MRSPNSSNVLQIVAGVYLIYLAYKLFTEGILQGEMTGGMFFVGIIASAVFVVLGGIFAGKSLYQMMRPQDEEESLEETPAEEENAAEALSAQEDLQTAQPEAGEEAASEETDSPADTGSGE